MQTNTIKGYKRGSLLHFERDGKKIAFDLRDLSFYKPLKAYGSYRKLKAGQSFFRNATISDVADGFTNPVYAELIRKVKDDTYHLKNFASLFSKLEKYKHLESYLLLGIRFGDTGTFTKPVSQFSKPVIEFMKESEIVFNYPYWERNYDRNPELLTKLCKYVRENHYLDLEVYRMLYSLVNNYGEPFRVFAKLSDPQIQGQIPINEDRWTGNRPEETPYGCEYKTLFSYLVMIVRTEAMDFDSALTEYRDYLKMMREMERNKAIARLRETNADLDPATIGWVGFNKIEKYPKYLATRHAIVSKNYRAWQDKVNELEFSAKVQHRYEYAWGGYRIVTPKKSDDIRNEGTNLHHCVASYVSRVMDGTTQIVFLRREDTESLVTVEIRAGAIVQARGYNNRSVDASEDRWLKTFAKAKNLSYKDVTRDATMPTPPVVALQMYTETARNLLRLSHKG